MPSCAHRGRGGLKRTALGQKKRLEAEARAQTLSCALVPLPNSSTRQSDRLVADLSIIAI